MRKIPLFPLLFIVFLFTTLKTNGQIVSFYRANNVPKEVSEINDIVLDQDSVIWMATNHGLLKQQGDSLKTIYDASRPLVYAFNSIYIDKNNVKWLGTYSSALVRFKDTSNIEVISLREYTENPYELVTAISKYENTVWATTASGQLFSYDIEEKELNEKNVPKCKSIYDLRIYHKNGTKWLATSRGMFEEKGLWGWKKIRFFKNAYGIYRNKNEYWAMGQNNQNKTQVIYRLKYYLSLMGLIDFPQFQWKDLILEGLGDPYLRFNDMDFDKQGIIWFATNDGIIRYDPEVGYAFPIRNDKYEGFNINQVKNIIVEQKNRIWVTSFGDVIYQIDFR